MQNGQKWPIGLNFKVWKTYQKLFGSWLSEYWFISTNKAPKDTKHVTKHKILIRSEIFFQFLEEVELILVSSWKLGQRNEEYPERIICM